MGQGEIGDPRYFRWRDARARALDSEQLLPEPPDTVVRRLMNEHAPYWSKPNSVASGPLRIVWNA
jgi:hypothetical protein